MVEPSIPQEAAMRRAHSQQTPPRRGRFVVLMIAAVAVLVAAWVGLYGLVFSPRAPQGESSSTEPTNLPSAPPSPAGSPAPGGDPGQFARLAAAILFDWDTTTDTPTSIRDRLLGWADPTGNETPGLVADLDAYLPDINTWATLRGYHTIQRLDITSTVIPASWAHITASASPGQLLPGTLAYTITGTRHRSGVAFGQSAVSDQPVTFTMFITCAPSFDQCHLMRLGQLGNPLP